MTTERIDIVVREDGSRVVRRNLEDIGGSARTGAVGVDRLHSSLGQLKTLMLSMGVGFGISEIIKYTDTWANLQGRLSLVTDSYNQMKQVQSELFTISQRTRTAFEGTADLYTRITRNTKELNATDRERLRVTETINKSLIVSGASSESANAAIVQLGQGFASGTLRGEELNSVLEQTPRLAEAIAAGMGKTQGQLRAMGTAGLLTSEAVFKALLTQGKALDDEFSRMPQTIGQSFTVLKNEVLKFVGVTSEANGVAGSFAGVLQYLASHLNVISGIIQGLLTYKIAEFFLTSAAAAIKKYLALIDSANALAAERAATIAAAEASLAQVQAQIAVATATRAAIITAREDAVAKLAQANSTIVSSQAAIAAARSAGALSFALRVVAESEIALSAAQARRAAMTAELAVLGQQQARVSAQIAAANAAEAVATTALAGARSGATAAAGLAGRALTALGGPIGIITTLLGLGATAWAIWGNKAVETETKVEQTLEQKTDEMIANLDKQIEKLKERNRIAAIDPTLGKKETPIADQQRDLLTKMNLVAKGGEGYEDLSQVARTEILRSLGARYNKLSVDAEELATEQEKLNKVLNGDKMTQWLSKHQEFMSKTDQLALAIKEAKKDLGEAFSPAIEKMITDHFTKKSGEHDSLLQYKESIEALKMQQKLQKEITDGELQHSQAQYGQGAISQSVMIQAELDAKLKENTQMQQYVMRELELTKGAGKEQIAARAQYNGELLVLEQQRKNIIQGTDDQIAGIYAARTRKEIDAGNADLEAINLQNQGIENKIRYFEMLPAAITRATIAELENQKAVLDGDFADQAKINSINGKIEALKRLANSQSQSVQQDFDFDIAQRMGAEWKRTGDIIANSLTTAFGKGGAALGKLVQGYTGFKKAESDLRKQYDERVKVAEIDAKRIRDAEVEYNSESVQLRMGAYADMAGAAKNLVGEQTAAYKILAGLEKAYRLAEMAMAYESMIRKIFFTEAVTAAKVTAIGTETAANAASVAPNVAADGAKASASGIAAVAKSLASLPFPANIAAGAAVLALLVSLGVAMSGGGGGAGSVSVSEQRQKVQGTGSVLGDGSAKSASIARAIEISAANSSTQINYLSGMLTALRNIENNIGGFASLLVRTTGVNGSFADTQKGGAEKFMGSTLGQLLIGGPFTVLLDKVFGGRVGKILGNIGNSIFGGRVTVQDTGLTLGKQTLGSVRSSGVFANQYTDTKEDGGWFSSDKYRTKLTSVGADGNAQFSLVIKSLAEGITEAGKLLGLNADTFSQNLNSFVVDIGKISMKGLTGEQIQQQLEAAFSKLGDDMAKFAVGGLDQFQKVGEGYLETLVRIATDYARLDAALQSIGKTFGSTGIASIAAREDLIALMGGIDKLDSVTASYAQNFLSEAEQLAPVQKYVTDQMSALGLASVDTREKFKMVISSLNLTSEKDRQLYASLMNLQEAFAKTHAATKDLTKTEQEIADERVDLQKQLDELIMTPAQLLAKQRAELDESNRALFDQINAIKAMNDANDLMRDSMQGVIDKFKSFAQSTKEFKNNLLVGELSPMTPEQQYAELRRQFEQTVMDARAGDEDAQRNFQTVANEFLTASQKINGGDAQYSSDFAMVLQVTNELTKWATSQVDIAQASLDALNKQVVGINDLNATMNLVAQSVQLLPAELAQANDAQRYTPSEDADYGTMQTFSVAPIVASIESVREELEKLREDQAAHSAQELGSNAGVTLEAATVIARAFKTTIEDNAYSNKLREWEFE